MAWHKLTVEVDDETLHGLSLIGDPSVVLGRLATAAASSHAQGAARARTDESLSLERVQSDSTARHGREGARRAGEPPLSGDLAMGASGAGRALPAEGLLTTEVALEEKAESDLLASARRTTDHHLATERAQAGSLRDEQREANAHLVVATLRGQELTEEAEVSKQRAEEAARELLEVARFRELFIGVLGHDLRNPISAIAMGAAGLLRRGHLDESDAGTVARILQSGQRMNRMVAQLLDFTRARLGGGFPIAPGPADLGVICRHVIGEFDAKVRLELAGDLTGVWDADRLEEALSNLIGNAVEYSAEGSSVLVKALAEEDEVAVEVTNVGPPIPADVLPYIFEPFRRAQQKEVSPLRSLGLGLYVANQIVLSHGGTLAAQCGGGLTTFVMRVPRKRSG